jgi:hypothetical protein
MHTTLNQISLTVKPRSNGRQVAGSVLLILFLFQGAAGALHSMGLHGRANAPGHHPQIQHLAATGPSFQAGPTEQHQDHDPHQCPICHHLLSSSRVLLPDGMLFVFVEMTNTIVSPPSVVQAEPEISDRQPRAPPSSLFSLA